jgi:hypothetical protein
MATEREKLLRQRYLNEGLRLQDQLRALGVALPTGGIDFSTGQRVSQNQFLGIPYESKEDYTISELQEGLNPLYALTKTAEKTKTEEDKRTRLQDIKDTLELYGQGDSIDPDELLKIGQVGIQLEEQALPVYQKKREIEAASNLRQMQQQLQTALPYIDEAQSRSIQRNLAASERFKAFKEQLPTTIQDIMSAKQQQLQTASDAFLREAQAAATQQQAASGFASLGTGRRFG